MEVPYKLCITMYLFSLQDGPKMDQTVLQCRPEVQVRPMVALPVKKAFKC